MAGVPVAVRLSTSVRMRTALFAAAGLFVAGLIAGAFTPTTLLAEITAIQDPAQSVQSLAPVELFFFILINNGVALSIAFVLSPLFCVVPVVSLVGNGWLIALAFSAALQQESLGFALVAILPHGVIEIPALLLALAASLRFGSSLTAAIFRRKRRALAIPVLVESARYLGIALLLLPAAALVEAYITPLFLDLI